MGARCRSIRRYNLDTKRRSPVDPVKGVHAKGQGATKLIHIGQAVFACNATIAYFIETTFDYVTPAECHRVATLKGCDKGSE